MERFVRGDVVVLPIANFGIECCIQTLVHQSSSVSHSPVPTLLLTPDLRTRTRTDARDPGE